MALFKTYVLFVLVFFPAIVPGSSTIALAQRVSSRSSSGPPSNDGSEVLGVWNRITIDSVNVYSRSGSEVNLDCTLLGTRQTEVECFSIQQNFWVSDSKGNMVLWVQNVIELAELEEGLFFATYAFFVWTPTDALQPLFCFPFSFSDSVCRSPIYTDPVRLPQSFTFYANISRVNAEYALHLSNDFAAQSWSIPTSIDCPCFIDTVRQKSPPWGYFPFEFVAVGLDNGSTAFFGNGTRGSVSPGMVQLVGGDWHLADMNTFHCEMLLVCPNATSTGESSANLRWDNGSDKFYWSVGASDQGNYIAGIHAQAVEPPILPRPVIESVLYIQMGSEEQVVPTIFDDEGRATGYDSSSGRLVRNIPHSFITLSGEVGIVIVNPNGSYGLTLTPLASGPFHLLVSKEFNINATKSIRALDGVITALVTEQYVIDSNTMALNLSVNYTPLLRMIGVALIWVTVIAGILVELKRRRSSSGNREDDS